MAFLTRYALQIGAVLLAFSTSILTGCGGSSGSQVAGKITFKGQPIPAGKIYILPDSTKGNSGQSGFADIVDGTYDTSKPGGQGAVQGAVIFAIEGIDPNPPPGAEPDVVATALFPRYETPQNISGNKVTLDIDVPASATIPKAPAKQSNVTP
jgi:hypothetical protein